MGIEDCVRIELTGAAYYNMLRSVIEVYPREPTGHVFGRVKNKKIIVTNAYPIQTAQRNSTSVAQNDDGAISRLRFLERLIAANGSETRFMGGYHSHTKRCALADYSSHDKDNIIRDTYGWGLEWWLEIILRIWRDKFKHEAPLSEQTRSYRRKLGGMLRYTPRRAYNLAIGAFLIRRDGRARELEVVRGNY